jgi:hypothetical protein
MMIYQNVSSPYRPIVSGDRVTDADVQRQALKRPRTTGRGREDRKKDTEE